MVEFDDLHLLLALVENIQNRRGVFRYLRNAVIGYFRILLLIQQQTGLYSLHIENSIVIPFPLFVDDSVCNKRLRARWLWVQHHEVEIVRILLVVDDQQQIILDLTEFDAAFDFEFTYQSGFVYIVYLHLFLSITLEHISVFIHT